MMLSLLLLISSLQSDTAADILCLDFDQGRHCATQDCLKLCYNEDGGSPLECFLYCELPPWAVGKH